jgi:UV DNA damage repair endonuclease
MGFGIYIRYHEKLKVVKPKKNKKTRILVLVDSESRMTVLAIAIRNLSKRPRMFDMNILVKFIFFYRFSSDLCVSLSYQ